MAGCTGTSLEEHAPTGDSADALGLTPQIVNGVTPEQALQVGGESVAFAELVEQVSGVDVCVCFQCGKCASGCPVSYAGDYTPTQLIHAVQLGLRDQVLRSKTIWLCSSCQICTTRCPQDVDVAGVINAVRIIAQRAQVSPSVSSVPTFFRKSVSNIALFGRMYELGLMADFKVSSRRFSEDLGLGSRMLRKGKFSLLPSFRGSRAARRIIRRSRAIERTS